jgi:hypothetical protein
VGGCQVLDWPLDDENFDINEAEPTRGMYEWVHEWMRANPDGLTGEPLPPTCIHGSDLRAAFTRGSSERARHVGLCDDDYLAYVRQAGSNRSAYIHVTPTRGDVLQVNYPASYNPKHEDPPVRLGVDGWRRVLGTLE